MLLLLSALAAAVQPPPAEGAWVEFDRRPAVHAASPFEYDSGSLRRDGPRVRVTYRHQPSIFSGLPDPEYRVGIEIDCSRNRARIYQSLTWHNLEGRRRYRPYRRSTPTIATPIAPGSIEESLARRVCSGPTPSGEE